MNQRCIAASLSVLLAAACADPADPPPEGSEEAQIQLAVTNVAAGIRCLRFGTEQAGMRKTEQKVSVTPGTTANVMLTGLAAGPVTINADAFTQTCGNVLATTLPAWVSDPVTRTLQPGSNLPVSFVFRPAAGVNGTVDFISLAISPTFADFGSASPGDQSLRTFTLGNTGPSPSGAVGLTFTGVDAEDFTVAMTNCTALPAGGSCTAVVRFSPVQPGTVFGSARNASLRVTASPGGSVAAQLTGRAF